MRRRRRMSASARATVRRWALSSLHGAELLGVLAVAVAARCAPLLPQPAVTNPSRATASARAPLTDILAELSDDLSEAAAATPLRRRTLERRGHVLPLRRGAPGTSGRSCQAALQPPPHRAPVQAVQGAPGGGAPAHRRLGRSRS